MQPTESPPPQLGPEHLRQLAEARAAIRKISRAVNMARFEGITLAVVAVLGVLCRDMTSFIVSAALAVIAFVELRSAEKLRQLDPNATKALTWNQVALGSVLIIYSAVQIFATLNGSGFTSELNSALGDLGGTVDTKSLEQQAKYLSILFYGIIIISAILFQGGMALYYRSRNKFLRDYLAQTPAWIVAMQRAGMSI